MRNVGLSWVVVVIVFPQILLLKACAFALGELMSKNKKTSTKMQKAEKNGVYYCDSCGCELVCTTPSKGPITCCSDVMCCC